MRRIIAWFKREKPIETVLEEIDRQIKEINQRRITYKSSWKNKIFYLVLLSLSSEVIYALTFYFYFLHLELEVADRIISSVPLVALPVLSWLIKNAINGYYNRRVLKDDTLLDQLKAKQRESIETLAKKTEFYKTQALINRYTKSLAETNVENRTPTRPSRVSQKAPQTPMQTPMKGSQPPNTPAQPPNTPNNSNASDIQMQQLLQKLQEQQRIIEQQREEIRKLSSPAPHRSGAIQLPPETPSKSQANGQNPLGSPRYAMPVPKNYRPQPIVHVPQSQRKESDPNRPWYDKLVDYLIGDGPAEMIPIKCDSCGSDNGLAPREEIPFMQFTCKACGFFNDAQAQKPSQESKRETNDINSNSNLESAETNTKVNASNKEEAEMIEDEIIEAPTSNSSEIKESKKDK